MSVDWDRHVLQEDALLTYLGYTPDRFDTEKDAWPAAKNLAYLAQEAFNLPLGFQFDDGYVRGPSPDRAYAVFGGFEPVEDPIIPARYEDTVELFDRVFGHFVHDAAWLEHAALAHDAARKSDITADDYDELYDQVRPRVEGLAHPRFDSETFDYAFDVLWKEELL